MDQRFTFLCDIDGTIADLSHRLHYISGEEQDWEAFHAACSKDTPIHTVIETVRLLVKAGAQILMVTGRADSSRLATEEWLAAFSVPYHGLWMRKHGDHRHDTVVKSELLDAILVGIPQTNIVGVFEDRNQVVKMWRDRGLKVFHVADGDY